MIHQYTYRAIVRQLIDHRSVTMDINQGLGTWAHEMPCELAGVFAKEEAIGYLQEHLVSGRPVLLKTQRDRRGDIGILVEIWVEGHDRTLNQQLVDRGLAIEVAR